MSDIVEQAINDLETIRTQPPLVHHITNWVTISECASITRSVGALPVMAHAEEEVEEMVGIASSLVLNIGTLTPTLIDAMIKAGKKANELGKPVVLDVVGAGATSLRTESTKKILANVKIAVIKGNAGEIATLAGAQAEVRGVESVSVEGDPSSHAKALARAEGCTVVVTAPVDLITDGERLFEVSNGHRKMGEVVGTGCMAASVIGAFVGVNPDYTTAAAGAMCVYGVAGEKAAHRANGPGTMKVQIFDAIMNIELADVRAAARVHVA